MKPPKVLTLYRQYSKTEERAEQGPYPTLALARRQIYSTPCQIPPEEHGEFDRIWDPDAPDRCLEYNCKLPSGAVPGQNCPKHEAAGRNVFCGNVLEYGVDLQVVRRCDSKVGWDAGCLVCAKCGLGADVARRSKWVAGLPVRNERGELPKDEESLTGMLVRGVRPLRIMNNLLGGFGEAADPDHVPTWPSRKK